MHTLKKLGPGLALVSCATAVAYGLNLLVSEVSALLSAIIIGMVLANANLIPRSAQAGINFAAKKLLRAGVVLIGFQLSLTVIAHLGVGAIVTIALTVLGTFLATLGLGKILKVDKTDTILVATGTSICGASAIAAMTAVVDAENISTGKQRKKATTLLDESAATALAGVTIFGTLSMLILPALVSLFGMNTTPAGVWIGSAIHEVGQVVAAGGFVSPEVQSVAVATKLGRVLTLAPMVIFVGLAMRRNPQVVAEGKRPPLVPLFVAGFIAMVIIRTVLGLPNSHVLPRVIKVAATLLLTAAMTGMGAAVKFSAVLDRGKKSLTLSLFAGIFAGMFSFLGIMLFV